MSGGFGATTQPGSSGLFGKPMTSFGTPSTTTTNSFAFNSTPSTNLFGSNTQAKPFGSKYSELISTLSVQIAQLVCTRVAFKLVHTSVSRFNKVQIVLFTAAAPTPLFATSNTNQTAGTGFGGINPAQNTGFGSTFGSTQPNQVVRARARVCVWGGTGSNGRLYVNVSNHLFTEHRLV